MSTKQTSERDEVPQEESQSNQPSAAEAKAIEQGQNNIKHGTESAGSACSNDPAAVADGSTRPQPSPQEGTAQDSQESSVSGGSSRTGSQQGGATGGGSGTESQQGGATGGVARQISQESAASVSDSGTGSLHSCDNTRESQLLGAVGGISRQESRESTDDRSFGDSQETAVVCDSSSRSSLESGGAGGVSNGPDLQESSANVAESLEGAVPVPSARRSSRVEFSDHVDEREQGTEELTSYYHCFRKCACVCDYLRPCSRRIRRSKIFMFLKLILFIIPISAFCMGVKYFGHCPADRNLPGLMVMTGVGALYFLVSVLALDLRRFLCPIIGISCFRALVFSALFTFLAFFAAALNSTYKISPSFDPLDEENYCNEVFYYYIYYTNFVIIGITLLGFFIYVPSLNDQYVEDYERL